MHNKTEQTEKGKLSSLQNLSFSTVNGIINNDWDKKTGKN